jgi:hypothetical protein
MNISHIGYFAICHHNILGNLQGSFQLTTHTSNISHMVNVPLAIKHFNTALYTTHSIANPICHLGLDVSAGNGKILVAVMVVVYVNNIVFGIDLKRPFLSIYARTLQTGIKIILVYKMPTFFFIFSVPPMPPPVITTLPPPPPGSSTPSVPPPITTTPPPASPPSPPGGGYGK